MRRIVVTGLGAVTPIGIGAKEFHDAQLAGKSGVRRITLFDPADLTCQIAGEVDLDVERWLSRKEHRRMDRFTHFAIAASDLAVQDSGIDFENEALERIGTFVGCGLGGMQTFEDNTEISLKKNAMRVSPFFIPMMIGNMACAQVAMRYGLMGASLDTVTACTSGADAIGQAFRALQYGEVDACLAGGAEATITPLGIGSFSVMRALSTRNDAPTQASRPFSQDRDGFVMGEGAGMLMLETLEHAQARGATIYAELKGYGRSTDAYHITDPHPEGKGATLAMQAALKDASLNPEDIQYVNAHATSTAVGDAAETNAIKRVFKDHAKSLAVSSTKSMTGHLLGAAGAIEAIASIQAIQSNVLPPTINLENPDPALDLDYVANEARESTVKNTLSNSFGFGGHNAALVFSQL